MKFTTRILFCITAFFALTFSLALTAGNPLAFQSASAVISLAMIASIAMPFVCSVTSRPFWAAYAICTGFSILLANTEGDPFRFLWYFPHYLDSRPPQGTVTYHASSAFFFVRPWIPSVIGLCGGLGFSWMFRFLGGDEA